MKSDKEIQREKNKETVNKKDRKEKKGHKERNVD